MADPRSPSSHRVANSFSRLAACSADRSAQSTAAVLVRIPASFMRRDSLRSSRYSANRRDRFWLQEGQRRCSGPPKGWNPRQENGLKLLMVTVRVRKADTGHALAALAA